MNCEQFKNFIPDYFTDVLNKENKLEFKIHADGCMDCRKELTEMEIVWKEMKEIPQAEPSTNLKIKFEKMLDDFKEEEKRYPKTSIREKLRTILDSFSSLQPAWQFAGFLLILTIGFICGYYFSSAKTAKKELTALHSEISEMRQLVSLSLLNQNSPSDRLQGVSWSQSVDEPNPQLFSALINTLNNDPNVNVRLAAANSLYFFSDQTDIRTKLVESLSLQKSPLVQVSLITLLVEIRERRALNALDLLLKNQNLNATVKEQAEWGIQLLKSL
jgi:hypothetical protein